MVKLILPLLLLLCSLRLEAATYYVRTTGSGSTCSIGSPCLSIVTAVGKATAPDDVVDIGAGTFTETTSATPSSGTSGHPIIIQGVSEASTIWTRNNCTVSTSGCILFATNPSYITIRDLTITGADGKTTLEFRGADGATHAGIDIHNVTFTNNGNRGALVGADDTSRMINFIGPAGTAYNWTGCTFHDLTLTANYGAPLWLRSVHHSTVYNNVATGMRTTGSADSSQFGGRLLIQLGSGNSSYGGSADFNEIYNNTIGAAPNDAVPSNASYEAAGIKGDTGASNNNVHDNLIYDFFYDGPSTSAPHAIEFESGCNNNTIKNNIITNMVGESIRLGSTSTGQNTGNVVDGNALDNGTCGLVIINSRNVTVKNNIFSRQADALVMVNTSQSTTITFNNNLHYDSNGGNSHFWGTVTGCNSGAANKAYAAWLTSSGETSSVTGDPLFVSAVQTYDYHLQQGSPAIGVGVAGINMGAYPGQALTAPVITSIAITAVNYDRFTITWTTDVTADSQVLYGTTSTYGSATVIDASLVTSHSVTITGLVKNTRYHFAVVSQKAGVTSTSGDFEAVTVIPPPTGGTIVLLLNWFFKYWSLVTDHWSLEYA